MKYSFLFILFFFSADCFSQQGVFKTDVIVDGDLSEWGEKLDHYDKENMLWYSVANDDDFLYLAIHKNKYALKAANRKVQVYFSESKISENSPSIIYPTTIRAMYRNLGYKTSLSWDFLVVNQLGNANSDTLSVFNDLGIQAQGELFDTEEGKKERQRYRDAENARIEAITVNGVIMFSSDNPPRILTPSSKGRTVNFEFAIPIKLLKKENENLNIKINLKGSSNEAHLDASILSNVKEGEGKEERLDLLTATEHSFTYTLAKKRM